MVSLTNSRFSVAVPSEERMRDSIRACGPSDPKCPTPNGTRFSWADPSFRGGWPDSSMQFLCNQRSRRPGFVARRALHHARQQHYLAAGNSSLGCVRQHSGG